MALRPTGSDELVSLQTPKVSLTFKGSLPPAFSRSRKGAADAVLRVFCADGYELTYRTADGSEPVTYRGAGKADAYTTRPMFFEQQRYQFLLEAADGHSIGFWHENVGIRHNVTPASKRHQILSGIINFGSEVGFSEFVIQADGANYLRLVLEVFPTKISYKEDYQQIMADVSREVYGLVFDFLRRTHREYKSGDHPSDNLIGFFAVIRTIYTDLLRSVDLVLRQPHHVLMTTHEVTQVHKVNRTDGRTMRWLERHPGQTCLQEGFLHAERALAVRKRVTYNTRENQLVKFILHSTTLKLETFRKTCLLMEREPDFDMLSQIDRMAHELWSRSKAPFFAEVNGMGSSPFTSLVFSMAPGYRDLYKYYLMLMHGLDISGDVFHMSLKDLATLYEYWCFIKLNRLMKDRYELLSQDVIKTQGKVSSYHWSRGLSHR